MAVIHIRLESDPYYHRCDLEYYLGDDLTCDPERVTCEECNRLSEGDEVKS